MTDKLNITIRIANQPPISLAINRSDEATIRTAEYNVNRLWNSWLQKYKTKSPNEVLAMVAFRFAELFYTQSAANRSLEQAMENFEAGLDKILLEMPDPGITNA